MRRSHVLTLLLAAGCATPNTAPTGGAGSGTSTAPTSAALADSAIGAPADTAYALGPDSTIVLSLRVAPANVASYASALAARTGAQVAGYAAGTLVKFVASPERRSALAVDDSVEYVEVESPVIGDGLGAPALPNNVWALGAMLAAPLPWGLDRINQRSLPLDASYTAATTGSGVDVYIIDTGINGNHTEFTGRMGVGFTAFSGSTADCQGHGTHVAGTVAGSSVGVAPGATIFPVRVLGCDGRGTSTSTLDGLTWVLNRVKANPNRPAVANMSLGGDANQATDDAVANLVAAGVHVAVAAGNDAKDACLVSPARNPISVTVGATDNTDKMASFSNRGSCVQIFGPGVGINSALNSNNTGYQVLQGTSMASPHVAGVLALWAQAFPTATPLQLKTMLLAQASTGKVSGLTTGSPDRLLYNVPASSLPSATPTVISLRLTPTTIALFGGEKKQFNLDGFYTNGSWTAATGVTWTVTGGGTISNTGLFTAPNTNSTIKVTGTAGGKSQQATVTVTAVSGMVIAPGTSQVLPTKKTALQAQLVKTAGGTNVVAPSVTWSTPKFGTIDAAGNYTAGNQTGVDTLTATHTSGQTARAIVRVVTRINAAPVPKITGTCTVASCTFVPTGTTDDQPLTALTLSWRVNDVEQASGSWANQQQFKQTFTKAGKYTITLVATDADGATGSAAVVATLK